MQKYPQLWWKYVEKYDEQCDDRTAMAECSASCLKECGINPY